MKGGGVEAQQTANFTSLIKISDIIALILLFVLLDFPCKDAFLSSFFETVHH